MKKCPNCGIECNDDDCFCTECGADFPQTKECPRCHTELKITAKFCSKCRYNFQEEKASESKGSMLGDKNVISGDVVGGNLDRSQYYGNVTNNNTSTTNVFNEDETKKVVSCHICGKKVSIFNATCFECHQVTCDDHLDKKTRLCHACIKKHEEQYRRRFNDFLEKNNGRLSFEDGNELMLMQKELQISDERKNAIEREARERHLPKAASGTSAAMSMFDRMAFDNAVKAFYEDGDVAKAAEELKAVKFGLQPNEELLSLKLSVLSWHDEAAFRQLVDSIHADLLAVSLAKIDMLLRVKELRGAEEELMRAEALWPSSLLVICRRMVLLYEMYNYSGDMRYLQQARNYESSLDPQNKLEASWCARVRHLLGKAFGEEVPLLTREYCRENNLYYAIANVQFEEDFGRRKRAEKGDAEAQCELARWLEQGEDGKSSLPEAIEWYRKSAEQGNANAQCVLATHYYEGTGCQKDDKMAFELSRQAAQQNHAEGQFLLSVFLSEGIGCDEDEGNAMSYLRKAAENGLAVAQSALGMFYLLGTGVESNPSKARFWIDKAKEQDYPFAYYFLWQLFSEKKKDKQDENNDKERKEALEAMSKAVKMDVCEAQLIMGLWYYQGNETNEVEKNYEKAVSLFKRAAENPIWASLSTEAIFWKQCFAKTFAQAALMLGICFFKGYGVEIDYEMASEWFGKASDAGDKVGKFYLGCCFMHGLGVAEDAEKAVDLLEQSAAMDYAPAYLELAKIKKNAEDKKDQDDFNGKMENGTGILGNDNGLDALSILIDNLPDTEKFHNRYKDILGLLEKSCELFGYFKFSTSDLNPVEEDWEKWKGEAPCLLADLYLEIYDQAEELQTLEETDFAIFDQMSDLGFMSGKMNSKGVMEKIKERQQKGVDPSYFEFRSKALRLLIRSTQASIKEAADKLFDKFNYTEIAKGFMGEDGILGIGDTDNGFNLSIMALEMMAIGSKQLEEKVQKVKEARKKLLEESSSKAISSDEKTHDNDVTEPVEFNVEDKSLPKKQQNEEKLSAEEKSLIEDKHKTKEKRQTAEELTGHLQLDLGNCGEEEQEERETSESNVAARYLKLALAESGDADAQYELGKCYENGQGVEQDYVEAVKWYREAAEQNNVNAQNRLGLYYYQMQNYIKAEQWFRKAAEQGHAEAQNNLGVCYYKGEGVDKDVAEAVKWYHKAAEQNNVNAQNHLGLYYYQTQNNIEAVQWFRKAADQGDAQAKDRLGYCYWLGKGIQQDFAEAVKQSPSISKCYDILKNIKKSQIYTVVNGFDSQKLANAIASYAPGVKPIDVLLHVDDTVWGGAKEGCIITATDIYWKEFLEKPKIITLSTDSQFSSQKKSIYSSSSKLFSVVLPDKEQVKMIACLLNKLVELLKMMQ